MHELGGLASADRALRARVRLEVPVLGKLTLKSFAIEMVPGIRFESQPPFAPDVVHVPPDPTTRRSEAEPR